MPPKLLAKRDDGGAKGVLPVTAAARAAPGRAPAPRLKLLIRRLPPALTLAEYEAILGDEWTPGRGKVDWREFRPGKLRPSAAKAPELGRCYMHLVSEAAVQELEARFLGLTIRDQAGTHRLPELKHAPPTIGYAPNQRVPAAKPRADPRQGTIDQDAEFMQFLQAETQPVARPPALDALGAEPERPEKEPAQSTPLIDALREKKASKAKAADAKVDKKDTRPPPSHASKENAAVDKPAKDGKPAAPPKAPPKAPQQRAEQVSKEALKALNKQLASRQPHAQQRPASPQHTAKTQAKAQAQAQAGEKAPNAPGAKGKKAAQPAQPNHTPKGPVAAPTPPAAANASVAAPPPRAPRPRGNAEGIKKMLQKDLGIKPKPQPAAPNTAPTGGAAHATLSSRTTPTVAKKEAARPSTPATTTTATGGPANKQATPKQHPPAPAPAPPTSKAYLKHANPSQGMTEILIQQALAHYGEVNNVTIDPRKGTAIALFKDTEGMKKALEAKKVPVANGSVEVLEWKDRGLNVGGRGGFHGRRGGGRGGGRAGGRGGGAQAPAAIIAPSAPKGGDAAGS